MEFGAFGLWHIAQTLIERLRSDKECGVQQGAVNLALEDAGAIEIEKALYEHFARAIEALAEGCILKQYERRNERRQSCCHIAERGIVPMPQHQRLRDGVAQRADAKLHCSAVGDHARDMETGRIFREIDWFARRGKQRKVGLRALQNVVEFFCR